MRSELELQITAQALLYALADQELVQILEVRKAFEEKNSFHQAFRVVHLVDRCLALVMRETIESPVIEHFRVQKILVDRGQLVRQHRVQPRDDSGVAFHLLPCAGFASAR